MQIKTSNHIKTRVLSMYLGRGVHKSSIIMGNRDTSNAVLTHLSRYVFTRDELYLDMVGVALLMSSNQTITLSRVAQRIANRPDIYLNSMVRALALTNGIVPYNMRRKVRWMRMMRA